MKTKTTLSRRSFLHTSAGLAAVPTIVSSRAFGANDAVVMGIIGAGGRGRSVMRSLLRQGAKFAAVSEIFQPNVALTMDMLEEGSKSYPDYRQLLERKDIDAVLIATPEHQHGVQLIDAVKAGKDAYCEKPMSHSIKEGNWIVKEVRKTKQIVQIGMQRRSSDTVHKAKKVIEDGTIGSIYFVKAWWNWSVSHTLDNTPLESELDWKAFCYPRKNVEFQPMKYRSWRYYWPFSGGNLTDQGTHLMDVVQWFMNSGTPKSAECYGGVFEMKGAETPDIFTASYDYGSFLVTWTLNYCNKYQNGWNIQFQGRKGTMMIDDFGVKVYLDEWKPGDPPQYNFGYDLTPAMTIEGGIPTEPHTQNFLDCVKSRNEPNAPVEIGHTAVCGPHLANVAWHNKCRTYLSKDTSKVSKSG